MSLRRPSSDIRECLRRNLRLISAIATLCDLLLKLIWHHKIKEFCVSFTYLSVYILFVIIVNLSICIFFVLM